MLRSELRRLRQLLALSSLMTRDTNREVRDCPSYRDGAHMDKYIRNMEVDLRDLKVSKTR